MTKISVIIPTFNREHFVQKAIKSVLEQTYTDFELIIVDDGSTDNVSQAISKFNDPRLSYIYKENKGVSSARNHGITISQGKYIAFLDSDDYWIPQKLEKQMRFFKNNPEYKIQQTQELWIRHGKRVNQMKKHEKPSGEIYGDCLKMCVITPSSALINKTIFNEIGLFDESLPACEDYDLWLRISCKYPVALIDENLIVKYGGHQDQLSRKIKFLDKYRIQAMQKMLNSGILSEAQKQLTITELHNKCTIYGHGCIKHNKQEEGYKYLNLAKQYDKF